MSARVWRGFRKHWQAAEPIGRYPGDAEVRDGFWDYEVFDFTPDTDLLSAAIEDARAIIRNGRHATRVAGGDPDNTERRLRMEYPGLAALIDHAEGDA